MSCPTSPDTTVDAEILRFRLIESDGVQVGGNLLSDMWPQNSKIPPDVNPQSSHEALSLITRQATLEVIPAAVITLHVEETAFLVIDGPSRNIPCHSSSNKVASTLSNRLLGCD